MKQDFLYLNKAASPESTKKATKLDILVFKGMFYFYFFSTKCSKTLCELFCLQMSISYVMTFCPFDILPIFVRRLKSSELAV